MLRRRYGLPERYDAGNHCNRLVLQNRQNPYNLTPSCTRRVPPVDGAGLWGSPGRRRGRS